MLSIVFMMVFGSWWVESAPFRVHLSALVMVAITVLSIILMIAIYPTIKRHNSAKRHRNNLDSMTWASDVSANLSTPAAVIKGYNVVFANKSYISVQPPGRSLSAGSGSGNSCATSSLR